METSFLYKFVFCSCLLLCFVACERYLDNVSGHSNKNLSRSSKGNIYYDTVSYDPPKYVTIFVGHRYLTYRQPEDENNVYIHKGVEHPYHSIDEIEIYNFPNTLTPSYSKTKYYEKITYVYRPEIVYDYYKPIYLPKKSKSINGPRKPLAFPIYGTYKKPNNGFSQTRTKSTTTHNTLTHLPIQSTKLHASSNAESIRTQDHNKPLHHHYENRFHALLEPPAQTNHPDPSYNPGPMHYNCGCNYKH